MKPWMAPVWLRTFAGLLILFIAPKAFSETMRVRLQRLTSPVSVSGLGLRFPGSSMNTDPGFRAVVVTWQKEREQFVWTIRDRDTNTVVSQLRSRGLELAGLSLRMNLKRVPDHLAFVPVATSRAAVDLVAKMELEDYLHGVVPAEMPNGWPIEALKAQAVAARTYALHRKAQRADAAYDVESDVTDQMFRQVDLNPLGLEAKKSVSNAEVAIRETRGVVLLDSSGQLLPTYFHADCGGRTEEAHDVWGRGAKHGTAIDKGCPLHPAARWTARFSARQLAATFNKTKLVELSLLDRTGSGRVGHLKLQWSDGTSTVVSGNDFRLAVGHERLRSTRFEVDRHGTDWEFRGQGFGHGAGLCQWGAKGLAAGGAFFTEILLHYYPSAVIQEPKDAVAAAVVTSTRERL